MEHFARLPDGLRLCKWYAAAMRRLKDPIPGAVRTARKRSPFCTANGGYLPESVSELPWGGYINSKPIDGGRPWVLPSSCAT